MNKFKEKSIQGKSKVRKEIAQKTGHVAQPRMLSAKHPTWSQHQGQLASPKWFDG